MIHYGKDPSGDLRIDVTADEVGEVYEALQSAGLLQRRTFDGLKTLIEKEFADDLETYRRRMTAQIPRKEEGRC